MNIIDAWKKAKEGQVIRSHNVDTRVKTGKLSDSLIVRYEDLLLADDWEVVREKKQETHTFRYGAEIRPLLNFVAIPVYIPVNSKVTIEWEE